MSFLLVLTTSFLAGHTQILPFYLQNCGNLLEVVAPKKFEEINQPPNTEGHELPLGMAIVPVNSQIPPNSPAKTRLLRVILPVAGEFSIIN